MNTLRFTRLHALGLGLLAGLLLGLALYDGCSDPRVVERERVQVKTRVVTKIERQEVKIPELVTQVKWRDRVIRPQIDTVDGRIDTVLLSEGFAARFAGRDTTNGGAAEGWIRSHPLRIEDLRVDCPPDTSTSRIDSVTIERTITKRPWVAVGVGPFAGLDHEGRIRYGGAVWAGLVIGSW